MFKFCKTQLWECSRTLSDVAMGRKPAETVIRNARLVNVCTHEILDNTDVAISCGRIALVGDAAHCIGKVQRSSMPRVSLSPRVSLTVISTLSLP